MRRLERENFDIALVERLKEPRVLVTRMELDHIELELMQSNLVIEPLGKGADRAGNGPRRDGDAKGDDDRGHIHVFSPSTSQPPDLMVRRMPAMRSPLRTLILGFVCLVLLAVASASSAQDGNVPAGSPLGGEVQIETDLFGVGSVVRPADFAAIRLRLTDRGDRVRDTLVRLHMPDPDGDEVLVERTITLNPGRPQLLWLYAHIPPTFDRQSLLTVTVHETAEGGGLQAGRQIAVGRIPPQRVVPMTESLIAIVGRRDGGLANYTVRDDSDAPSPTWHELINVIGGIEPDTMPDAWMGLAPFEALVWMEGDPTDLRADQAAALREWILRGGRLFIVLPSVGELWTNTANPLFDVLPAMKVTRREGVNLEAYRRLLSNRQTLPLPGNSVVHVFEAAPFAGEQDAMPILAGPDGAPIAMRRLIGLGDVTVVGLDLASPALTGRIDAQLIWHRLLGKRFEVLTRTEVLDTLGRARTSFPRLSGDPLDQGISNMINKTGSAGVGVLLGLIVFATYFLLAGPIGFGLLNKWGWRRHAWLAFIGVAAAFTIVAWGGASVVKPRKIDITHLTFLDGVYGQNIVRARSWFSVLLPTYGAQTVSIGDDEAPALGARDSRNALWPWQDPASSSRTPFPDRREYIIDARRPDSIRVPTRSTVKEFESWWIGPPPWRLPRPVDGEIRVDANSALSGALAHELPEAMENVQVVLNLGQQPLSAEVRGSPLPARIFAWAPFGSEAWPSGAALDLAELDLRDAAVGQEFFESIQVAAARIFASQGDIAPTNLPRAIQAITWHGALEPPDWRGTNILEAALRRRITHTLDLSRWLTQPCLIVVGELPNSQIPSPIFVEGETPPSNGRTIIRWVYPLAPNPPRPASDGAS